MSSPVSMMLVVSRMSPCPSAKPKDRLVDFRGRQFAVHDGQAKLRDYFPQPLRHRLQIFDARANKEALAAASPLIEERIAGQGRIEPGRDRTRRQSPRRWRLQGAQ